MNCCHTEGLDQIFTDRVSARDAQKFRRHGLHRRGRKMIRALERTDALRGRTLLEVGIGVGALTVEMLRHGATRAIGVDAMAPQLHHARILAEETEVADRLELKQADFAELTGDLSADIVVLDRVICCYPDWQSLLGNAASRARITVLLSYPRAVWYNRVWVAAINFGQRVLRRAFRFHLHSPLAMHTLLREQGFTPRVVGHHFAWELLVAQRA